MKSSESRKVRAGARPVAGVLDQRCASIQCVGEETVDHPRALAATRPATVACVAVFSRILTKSRTHGAEGPDTDLAGRKGSHCHLKEAIAVDQLGYSLSGGGKKVRRRARNGGGAGGGRA